MSSAPKPNIALLQKTLQYIKENPGEWLQQTWACGTAGCFAGHAVRLSGAVWAPHDGRCDGGNCTSYGGTCQCRTADGSIRQISEVAREVLGIDVETGQALFWAMNTLERLEALVGEITASAIDSELPAVIADTPLEDGVYLGRQDEALTASV